ncbi:MAG: 23S rRNA (pseudouridine(1915)-N(3))-methyltransferase RlmH [Hyphomicrobiales bacterium]|nr:MAG: 23S rRNA (pseudouridine(1915)-N(3))-methyltransferase RlmH [Hyphomicrobiales bacterium]
MRIVVSAVGRLKAGAERDLCDRYRDRADKAGRALGFTAVDTRETAESRASRTEQRGSEEATALLSNLPEGTFVVALDETGKTMTSRAFADRLSGLRDRSIPEVRFLIGGADGHGDAARQRADLMLSLGPMTYPHQIARALILEQVYRAITILAGHPYHRD